MEIEELREKGSLMNELIVYETPRASVRGVFLCENLADTVAVSVLTAGITQEGWGTDIVMGADDADTDGDVWLGY